MDVTIYHNPACGTSRNTLALIRAAGIEPTCSYLLSMVVDLESQISDSRSKARRLEAQRKAG